MAPKAHTGAAVGDPQRSADTDVQARLNAAVVAFGLVGHSPSFRAALDLLTKFAGCDAPVLLRGATGTGKELFARALHYLGRRAGHAFVPVNCGALPDTLLESELFGHVRGAFTDARTDRPGLVTSAEHGTLFLDEVDSLSPHGQIALLRFLQDREYRPVGGRSARTADVRVLAATNADLAALVVQGRFRQDLLFRLDILAMDLPCLAERPEDIPLLARHFAMRFATLYGRPVPVLDPAALAWLMANPWPGNVRELENVMHRAVLLAEDGRLALPGLSRRPGAAPAAEAGRLHAHGGLREVCARGRRETEERYLRGLIAETGGNVSEAARRAGVERRAMGRMLKHHGLVPGLPRPGPD
ncbi:sigma-54 interaction domain-containing protein [Paracraurococcus lichenis]|uniref:Sigma-54 dependent transcriptional regulator n=1 Tax=Paracraurococcus lichenis TaxID=3064888 RepID=A0ABT9EDA0_9PROT|nr:sigma-54 dependent transcriptional regulator [Paracraurococcus sp. LOR1-02]MDO9714197.1 sigma-54 dependent transcriptional regulator [Paracraurococcus sp. LOR1-02]